MIENKIANSGLVNFDLESLLTKGIRTNLDITEWLWQGLIIKEKELKQHLKDHNWTQYQDQIVYITCKADAIIPNWAYMLIASELQPFAKFYFLGSKQQMNETLFALKIEKLNIEQFSDSRVLVKGCSESDVPANAYVLLTQKLLPVVKSMMFGEACSNVPIYKQKKK